MITEKMGMMNATKEDLDEFEAIAGGLTEGILHLLNSMEMGRYAYVLHIIDSKTGLANGASNVPPEEVLRILRAAIIKHEAEKVEAEKANLIVTH